MEIRKFIVLENYEQHVLNFIIKGYEIENPKYKSLEL